MKLIGWIVALAWKLAVAPVKLALAIVGLGLRVSVAIALTPFRLGWGMTRRAGVKALACFALGALIALVLAPRRGAEVRASVMARLSGPRTPPDADLADQLRRELAHAPATWHLPQPQVAVDGGVATLTGSVDSSEAADALERTAAALPGVLEVCNQLVLAETSGQDESA